MTKRTASTWGAPPTRYYAFLARLALLYGVGGNYDLAVLGCADGKFVVPAARRRMHTLANGRLVVGPDQTITTGWGEGDGKTVPRYHNQFARFRGYAFFDCDDASRLPWTTTKTGVDAVGTAADKVERLVRERARR